MAYFVIFAASLQHTLRYNLEIKKHKAFIPEIIYINTHSSI